MRNVKTLLSLSVMPSDSIFSPAQSRSQQQLSTTWQGSNIGTLNNQDLLLLTILKQSQGIEVLSCMSTALKVLQLQLQAYDLLLSDLGLPETDGWTFTTESKGDILLTPVIYGINRERNTAWLLGFQMLLSKPLADDEPTSSLMEGSHMKTKSVKTELVNGNPCRWVKSTRVTNRDTMQLFKRFVELYESSLEQP